MKTTLLIIVTALSSCYITHQYNKCVIRERVELIYGGATDSAVEMCLYLETGVEQDFMGNPKEGE